MVYVVSISRSPEQSPFTPYNYFRDVFIKISQKMAAGDRLQDLLPHNWKPQAI